MSLHAVSTLPFFDRNLLRAVERIVPAAERGEWLQTWRAELWHLHHHPRRQKDLRIVLDLSIGLLCDALWLRTDSWSRALSGTPALCLVTLAGFCLLSALTGLALAGSWHGYLHASRGPFERSLFAAMLVVFVSFAKASRGYVEQRSVGRLRWQAFFGAKAALVLLLSFLLSADFCRPVHAIFPNTADALQLLMFVPFALIGLRWAFADQEQRCKQCLRLLAGPARVGRPSHNLLEWSGTELACKQGHGLLSVPEMETSWGDSSRWVELDPVWE
ncbi:MAG: hypothetical protein M3O31_11425 [Acidobacteriota bacterium]|nr:hypothetical protein [Acidobacteriota bacterium]